MRRGRRTRTLPVRDSFRECALEQARHRLRGNATAPVVVPDAAPGLAAKAAVAGPAYVVLAGISFSHFLNDTMQSLIASVYPILKDAYALDFAQIGMITLAFQFTASLLQPRGRAFHRQEGAAVLARDRHGLYLLRLAAAERRAALSRHPDRGRAGRARLGGVSSGVGADRAAGLGRALRLCAIGVSARRQFRHLDGAGAGGLDRGAVRPAQRSPGFPRSRFWRS